MSKRERESTTRIREPIETNTIGVSAEDVNNVSNIGGRADINNGVMEGLLRI